MSKGATCERKNSSGGRVFSLSIFALTLSGSVRILSRSSEAGSCARAGGHETNPAKASTETRQMSDDLRGFTIETPSSSATRGDAGRRVSGGKSAGRADRIESNPKLVGGKVSVARLATSQHAAV